MRTLLLATLAAVSVGAAAKLPPLSDDAKAKAAEAAAKTAHGTKLADFQLCKSMEKVAARYAAEASKAGKTVTPTPTPACTDPGPYAAVAQPGAKPLEAAGAHSPPAPAATPPSTNVPAAKVPSK